MWFSNSAFFFSSLYILTSRIKTQLMEHGTVSTSEQKFEAVSSVPGNIFKIIGLPHINLIEFEERKKISHLCFHLLNILYTFITIFREKKLYNVDIYYAQDLNS